MMAVLRRVLFVILRNATILGATCVLLVGLTVPRALTAQEMTTVIVVPTEPVAAGGPLSVWLVVLNAGGRAVTHTFPSRIEGRLTVGGVERPVGLALRIPAEGEPAPIPPGAYLRREYVLTLPADMVGKAVLDVAGVPANPVIVQVVPPTSVAKADETKEKSVLQEMFSTPVFDPEKFFLAHFFSYEPFYFMAGTEQPNAKFQVSFRYQILNNDGPMARRYPWMKGFNVAYSQTSLWDWSEPSAPFFDTSYRPELLYLMQRVDEGRWADWFRLDLQAGVKHESNGQDDEDSRSLNTVYFEPSMRFGKDDGLQLTLAPRVFAYVGSLSDNPDIAKYRGYFGLRAVLGWAKGLQLATVGRLGEDANRGSIQLDLSYPLMQVLFGNFSLYLYAQYFYGYGESLIEYNQRGSSFRAGLALARW